SGRTTDFMRFRSTAALLALMAATSPARAQAPSTTSIPAKGGDITITALGQDGKVILVDPVGAQTDLSKAKPADLILVSDVHPDHLDPGVIGRLRKPGAPVAVPPAVAALKNIPDPVVVMTNREMKSKATAPAGIKVISVPAYNIERGPAPGQLYHPRERGQGYLLFISDKLVYVAADTECVPAMDIMLRRPQVDVAIMPMNLPYTMTPA